MSRGVTLLAFGITSVIAVAPLSASAQESPKEIGFYCVPDESSIVDGQYYEIQANVCVFETSSLGGFGVYRYAYFYKGEIGNAVRISGQAIGWSNPAALVGDLTNFQTAGVQQGDSIFLAVFQMREPIAQQDAQAFDAFFQHGTGAPPHDNYAFIRFTYGVAPETQPDPVIIIPGILGSEQVDGEWVIDPILHTYDDLIATLDVNHYTPGVDLFPFPYNWRKSNVETAVLLKEEIDKVKAICDCDKVDLVAHSMGGLVARQYIQSDAYEQDVDQLIFLGTPHLGAPKAYLMWEGGELGPRVLSAPLKTLKDEFGERILALEAKEEGFDSLFDYIRNAPIHSVKELLPIYDYVFDGNQLRNYPDNYPENQFLVELGENLDLLQSSGVEIHNITGDAGESSTINGITVVDSPKPPRWEHGYPVNYELPFGNQGLLLASGDMTVPTASASIVSTNLRTKQYSHDKLVAASAGDVYETLTGQVATTIVSEYSGLDMKSLLIKMLSPADLLIVAPDGKKIGKENGAIINEIPGAFYTGFNTNTEFITILNPIDGEYTIVTEGIESGEYTVETDYITDATTTSTRYTGTTVLGEYAEHVLTFDADHLEEINITGPDREPPTITISSPLTRDYERSMTIPVEITTEDLSGVASLEVRLGTTTIPNHQSLDLFFLPLGTHMLVASAEDIHGNATTSSRELRVIATASSTVADINRTHSLGWMTTEVRDILLQKMQSVLTLIANLNAHREAGKFEAVAGVEQALDNVLSGVILKELERHRGKGLDERAYYLLKEDIAWLINN